ncbi:MAG: hypothetical protein ACXAAM_02750, partial [Candidatus Heimdallarchaeaceae archaeon]
SVNISEDEQELINQFLMNLETIVNEQRQWEIETIIEGEGLEGVIQAFLSMIIANFDKELARFRVYPRFVKKLENGKFRIHSSTRVSPTDNIDMTWTLKHPKGEFQKLAIESVNSMTVPLYEESQRERTEITRQDEKWKGFMRAIDKVKLVNRIYMRIKEDQGKAKAKAFFNDKEQFEEELDNLFGFLEGQFKITAYIAVIGSNVYGWKGVIMKKNKNYEVVFDDYRDLEALESLTDVNKMTEEEYLDLIAYQWKERTKKHKLLIEIDADKDKQRLTFKIMKKPPTPKKPKKLVKGERTIKQKTTKKTSPKKKK